MESLLRNYHFSLLQPHIRFAPGQVIAHFFTNPCARIVNRSSLPMFIPHSTNRHNAEEETIFDNLPCVKISASSSSALASFAAL